MSAEPNKKRPMEEGKRTTTTKKQSIEKVSPVINPQQPKSKQGKRKRPRKEKNIYLMDKQTNTEIPGNWYAYVASLIE